MPTLFPGLLAATLPLLLAPLDAQETRSTPGKTDRAAQVAKPTLADAPHLFHREGGSVLARWVVAGKVEEQAFKAGEPIVIPAFRDLLGAKLVLRPKATEADTWPLPAKLLVISDVEGEYTRMRSFLGANGVVDDEGRWAFGKGHLVCVGDMVDRGTQVTETLWMLYRLAGEAQAAGGHLHYVLGNHEVMMMGGDVRYTAPKYEAVAKLFGRPVSGLLGEDTVIGRWLRTRNAVVKVGRFVFVHAGLSPPLVTENFDLGELNARIRSGLGLPQEKIRDRTTAAILWGRLGPLWYRGYFKEWEIHFGPTPSPGDIDRILSRLGAKTLVIGHTKVKAVTDLYGRRRVLAIDVPWTRPKDVCGLLIRGEKVEVVDRKGGRTRLK